MPSTPVPDTIVDFLQEAVTRHGSRDALLIKPAFRYLRWSYDKLWEDSGRIATLLQRRGLEKGDQAILWGPNSPHWVLAFFGCLRAGVVLIPLDLRSAPDYVARVISRTDPKIAFISRLTPKEDVQLGVPEITFEELEPAINGLPAPDPVLIHKNDLAEIMFTSGTTGDPKGVMLTHRNLTANIEGITQYVTVNYTHRLLSLLPLSHMYEQMGGLFITLHSGASVTYPTSRQPTVLSRTMRERKITTMLMVPQALELLMNGIEREVIRQGKERLWKALLKVAGRTPFSLRRRLFRTVHKQFGGKLGLIVSGGAPLDRDLGRKWELLGVKVLQGYGATEASPVISNHTMDVRRPDSTGRPLPNVQVKISDQGEILVKGENITPGYYNAPEVTAKAFEDGWYKTGDLGFFDDDGFLHIQGRVKDMIVLPSGQNVFPQDIQTLLVKHSAIKDAVVIGLARGTSVEVHAALILDDPDSAQEAVDWTNSQLAEQQRVRGFTIWPDEDFPRTHTLKVKNQVVIDAILRGPERSAPSSQAPASTPPTGPRDLISIIAELSRREVSLISQNSTLGNDLDLDSLGRIELLSAVESELGIYLDESQVSPETTVRRLSSMVEEGSRRPPLVKFPAWGMRMWARMARGFLQQGLVFPLLTLAYGLKVSGKENLTGLNGPVLFASNHHLGLDNPIIFKAVTRRWRRRLAVAAAAELWQNPIWWVLNPLLGNGFPIARSGPIRPSLENLGRIMDQGWSVLIYPEGVLTVGGPMKPFMQGAGLVAVEGRVPVVPMRLDVAKFGLPSRLPLLRRGRVEVRFGPPITFPPGTDYQHATSTIEEAVKSL